jgi:hypothetical protein
VRPVVLGVAAVAASAVTLAVAAGPAGATNECRGLQVCVPVAGPWVVVPGARTVPRLQVDYQLKCPKGYIVGGLDAELTSPTIDVSFRALLGSPVNPGITTSQSALFTAVQAGTPSANATFRPHIGCMPSAGGGQRIPTVAHVVAPGHPTARRVWTVRVRPGVRQLVRGCAASETLVAASHALGFYTKTPPTAVLVAAVRTRQSLRSGKVALVVHAGSAVSSVHAVVQIDLTCAGGA